MGLAWSSVLPMTARLKHRFRATRFFRAIPAMLHGGVVSTLLDGAMTNCLFAHGHRRSDRRTHMFASGIRWIRAIRQWSGHGSRLRRDPCMNWQPN